MNAGWIRRSLRSATTKIGSGATPLGGESNYKQSGTSLIRSLNVHDGEFRWKDLAFIDDAQAKQLDNVVVESGDVLLNITGASVARCCIVPNEVLPARVNQHVSILRPVADCLLPGFLQYMLVSRDYKNQLLSAGDGGATRQALTKAQLQDFAIVFPESLAEQRRIVGILDEAFEGIATAKANAEKNLQNARALFNSFSESVFQSKHAEWQHETMVEVCSVITCGVASTPKYVDEQVGIPFLSAQNVKEGKIVLENYRFISSEFHEKLTKKNKPKKDDILYSRVGAKYGEAGVVEHDFEFSV